MQTPQDVTNTCRLGSNILSYSDLANVNTRIFFLFPYYVTMLPMTNMSIICCPHMYQTMLNFLSFSGSVQCCTTECSPFNKKIIYLDLCQDQQVTSKYISAASRVQQMIHLHRCSCIHGRKFKISKILNFRNFNLKTCSMPTKYPEFQDLMVNCP